MNNLLHQEHLKRDLEEAFQGGHLTSEQVKSIVAYDLQLGKPQPFAPPAHYFSSLLPRFNEKKSQAEMRTLFPLSYSSFLRYVLSATIFYFTFLTSSSWNASNSPSSDLKLRQDKEFLVTMDPVIDHSNETVFYVAAEFSLEELLGFKDPPVPIIIGENTLFSFISLIDINTLSDSEMLALAD